MGNSEFTNPVDDDSVPKVDNAVAVGEDLQFQEKWWRFERIIWSIFVVVLLADVLGVFGRGWLSRAELHGQNSGVDVKYERVARAGTPSILALQFRQDAVQNGAVQIFVSKNLVQELGTQRVVPQPERSVVGNGGITYTFPVTGHEPENVDLELEPSFPGVHRFTLQVPGKQAQGGTVVVVP